MQTHAIKLAKDYGFAVFPVSNPVSGDANSGKKPLVRWKDEATTDIEKISKWWQRWPNANIGIKTGPDSGIFVLDIDVGEGKVGLESLQALESKIGPLNPALIARTGGGGLHLFFAYPQDGHVPNSAGRIAPNIDVRGDGGYVVAPPSQHQSGKFYEWIPQ